MISKFDGWHRKKIIGNIFHAPRRYVCHFIAIREFKLDLSSGNATPSFVRHFIAISEFKLTVTVWKRSIGVKIGDFVARVTLKFNRWPWKTVGHIFYATSSLLHYFVSICEFALELQSGKTQIGAKFVLISVTLTFDLWQWPLHGHHFCQ